MVLAGRMKVDEDKDRPDGSAADDTQPADTKSKRADTLQDQVGTALRTVYQRTIEEDLPPELASLLDKLA